jgi:hypothetical protein
MNNKKLFDFEIDGCRVAGYEVCKEVAFFFPDWADKAFAEFYWGEKVFLKYFDSKKEATSFAMKAIAGDEDFLLDAFDAANVIAIDRDMYKPDSACASASPKMAFYLLQELWENVIYFAENHGKDKVLGFLKAKLEEYEIE